MNYLVKNAGHGYDLVNLVWSATDIMARGFVLYTGDTSGLPVIAEADLAISNKVFSKDSILSYQGNTYQFRDSLYLKRDNGQIQGGGTYLFYIVDDLRTIQAMRLDSEKYPDLVVNDWRYISNRDIKPLVKICVPSDGTPFESCQKTYYLNGTETDSPLFITSDTIDMTPRTDGQANIVPNLSYVFYDGSIQITTDTPNVNATLHIANKKGVMLDDEYPMTNSTAIISNKYVYAADGHYSFDVLFGFTKKLTVTA